MKQDNEHIPEGYKDSPLGVIPEGWKVKRLGEVCVKISDGIHGTPKYVTNSNYFFINGNNLVDGKIKITQETKCISESEYISHQKKLDKRTILVSINGTIGNIAIYNNEKVILGKSAAYLVFRNEANFYYHLLQSSIAKNHFNSELSGSTIKNLSLKSIKSFAFALPSLPEQKKIAEILSTWDDAIERQSKLVDSLAFRKRGLMQQLLTGKNRLHGFSYKWESIKVRDLVSKLSNGLTYDTTLLEGKPVTRIETISDGEINFDKIGFAQNCSNIESYKLEQGDILYSHINSLSQIGKIAYYNDNKPLYHGMNLLLIRTNDKNISKYLYYYLSSKQAKNIAQTIAKPAVNQASISTTDLLNIKIKYPKPEEQTAIAERLTAADIEIELAKQKLSHLRNQKRGLMQQLLTGQIRITI